MYKQGVTDLYNVFYGEYTKQYCEENQLFYVENPETNEMMFKTKSLVDYGADIINTDLRFIIGEGINIKIEDETKQKRIMEILNQNKYIEKFENYILNGLITGDTALYQGRDAKGNIYFDVQNISKADYKLNEYGEVEEWLYTVYKDDDNEYKIKYRKDYIQKFMNDEPIGDPVENQYNMFWFIHTNNLPDVREDVWGRTELTQIIDTMDYINSLYSSFNMIQDKYANPLVVVKGVVPEDEEENELNMVKRTGNTIYLNDTEQTIEILEYKGNVIGSFTEVINSLKDYMKSTFPELWLNTSSNLSGIALEHKLKSLDKKIKKYKSNYFEGIKQLIKLVAKMEYGKDTDIKIEITSENTLNVNQVKEQQEKEDYMKLYTMGLISKQTLQEKYNINYIEEQNKMKDEPI